MGNNVEKKSGRTKNTGCMRMIIMVYIIKQKVQKRKEFKIQTVRCGEN